jgi:hypothetical protein
MGRCGRTGVLPLKRLLLASGHLEERGENFRRVSIHMVRYVFRKGSHRKRCSRPLRQQPNPIGSYRNNLRRFSGAH